MTNLVEVWLENWFGVIGSVTPAFKQYAMSLLLTQANYFNQVLHLNLPDPITTNQVTEIRGAPMTNGLGGSITVNNRFAWSISDERVNQFTDLDYYSRIFNGNDDLCETFATMTNLLTTNRAISLARGALAKLSIPLDILDRKEPVVRQFTYDNDKEVRLLPLYELDWGNVHMEVSGVISNVVRFYHSSGALRVPPPTNYFEIIGATNEATRTPRTKLRKEMPAAPQRNERERPKTNLDPI